MAFSHGRIAVIKMDNAAGTLFDISTISNSTDMSRSVETAETTSFGSQKTYVLGLEDGTVSISGSYDNVLDATISAAIDSVANGTNATLTIEYGPQGSTTGKPKFTLEAIPTTYSISTPVGGVATFKLDFQRSGAITRSTYA